MLGAIAGDIIGSVYEHNPINTKDFPLFSAKSSFTDDTVMSVAVADALLSGARGDQGVYVETMQKYGRQYPHRGYGGRFSYWLVSGDPKPYNSYGNGSAMRVCAVAFLLDSLDEVLVEAKRSAEVTHNHPEGIKGAQAVAAATFLARIGSHKDDIRSYIAKTFKYDLDRTLEEIRGFYTFDVTCQGSVPESILAFLESTDYEDAIRNAISLGGDSDTMACIAGGIAEAYYKGLPETIRNETMGRLDDNLKEQVLRFYRARSAK